MGKSDDYTLFFETSPQPLYIVSKSTMNFLAVNEAMVLKYGYTKAELLSMTLRDIRPKEDVAELDRDFATSEPELSKRNIWRHQHKDGSIFHMDITARTIDWHGEEARFVMATDLTSMVVAMEELASSKERLRVAISEAPYPVMIHAEGAEVLSVSRSWVEGTGYELQDLENLNSWTDIAFQEECESIRRGIAEVQNRQTHRHQKEYEIRCKDGSIRTWDIVTVPAGQLSDGRNVAISCGYDITERIQLTESLKLKSTALDAVADEVIITDRAGVVEWVNPSFFRLGENSSGEHGLDHVKGSLSSAVSNPRPYQELWDSLLAGQPWRGELVNHRDDGTRYYEEAIITPVVGSTGTIDHFIGIKQDITDRKRAADLIETRLKLVEESKTLSVLETLRLAVDEACRLCQSTNGFFHFVAPDQETFTIQAWSTATAEHYCASMLDAEHLLTSEAGIWAECVRTQKPLVHNHFDDIQLAAPLPDGHPAITREIIVPIIKEGKVAALMALGNKSTDYGQEDIEIVSYIADIVWQITKQRTSEDLLNLQAAALQAADNAIVITNTESVIEWINPAFSRLTGYTFKEALGRKPRELVFSGLETDEFYQEMWETILSKKVWSGDIINKKKDGKLYIEEQTITPMIGRTGEIEHYIGIKEDVTNFRKSEALLQARLNLSEIVKGEGVEEALKHAIEQASLLTFSQGGCFKVLEPSPVGSIEVFYGSGPDECCMTTESDDPTKIRQDSVWDRCLATRKAQIQNNFEVQNDSEETSLRIVVVPVMKNDDVVAMMAVEGGAADYLGDDVETVSYIAEIAYGIVQQHLGERNYIRQGALLEQLYDAVFAWRLDGHIVYWNKGAERLYGYSSKEAIGQSVHSLLRTEFSRYSSEHATALIVKERWEGELTNISKSGRPLLVESRMTLTSDPEEQLVLEVNRDISATRSAEEQLLMLNSELEERVLSRTAELSIAKAEADKANSAKSEFLSRMSHELRTPLNSILGFSQILQLHHPEGQIKDLSDPIIKAGTHLLGLINEILDIARIEAGRLVIDNSACPAKAPLNDALDLIAPLASSAGIAIHGTDKPLETWITADARRLVQVILNVLSNAVKYNRHGGDIWLRWNETEEEGQFILRIQDSGLGIEPENLPRLFEPFARFGDQFVEGTGLGLPLSQRLIHLMGGDLYLESSGPAGSTFVIKVPSSSHRSLPSESLKEVPDYLLQEAVSGSILYIEDDLGNIQLMDHLIALFPGLTLLPAMQGGLGLELALLHKPNLILLDAQLPDLTGLDVLTELKANPDTRGIPVVILTAGATEVLRESFTNAGALDFITKPINVENLMRTISSSLGGRQ